MGTAGAGKLIFVESMLREGVEVIFGIPGGAALGAYDALYDSPIRFVLARQEAGAGHAAEGYARVSGKVGVCLVTSGPGITNLLTAIADAYMDSVPIVAISGQVSTPLIGNDAFQEVDAVGITRPCTKHNYLVKSVDELSQVIQEAFYIARTGRPGPVHIDIPKDIMGGNGRFLWKDHPTVRGYNPSPDGHIQQIRRAARAIRRAARPVLYVGGGVISSDASPELRALAELMRIPVTTTLMGLGAFPSSHELSLGMLGMHGAWYTNTAMTNCDLLIAVGARFDDRVTGRIDGFCPKAKIIHIDIDPSSISKNVRVDLPIVGDAKRVLAALLEELRSSVTEESRGTEEWLRQIAGWRQQHPLRYTNSDKVIKPQYVIEQLSRATRGEPILVSDVGQHQMWVAQFYEFSRPRRWLTSGGLGTMGYGLPAAIGSQIAAPREQVVAVLGDGGFQMNMQELATVVENELPIKIIIINNSHHGMVRQWQELFFKGRFYGVNLSVAPDYVALARSFGIDGMRVSDPAEIKGALEYGLNRDGTFLFDFRVDPEEGCYPLVPPGAAIGEMVLERAENYVSDSKDLLPPS